jgi:hypothetical protein
MSTCGTVSKILLLTIALAGVTGCDEDEKAGENKAATTAKATPTPAPQPTPAPKPSAEPEPHHDCPEGSTGVGSFAKPCEAKGTTRVMTVQWTGKMGDNGPSFRVTNTSKLGILYGKLAVYFYDKKGKQLEVADSDKKSPMKTCAGNIFDGEMKAGEKAVITFSCVKKATVPEDTDAIQAEIEVAGFTDETGKKNDFYWRNKELTPDARPKAKK